MKRLFVLLFSLLINALLLNAQTQQGYVKTKGRLGNNGTVIAGTRISGVTVQIKGRQAVLSQKNGTFSFPIPAQNFYLQNVQKQGYVMTDPDMLSRQYTYSKNPLIIVLETREQQADDKLAAEKKIRRTLQRQLQEKEDEIESLKEQKKLSDEEYRRQLQELYAQQENNEKLISEMADRYSRMDFDEVDDFNRRISQLILDGRLKEADSLINTKGDIRSRAATLKSHQEANAQTEIKLKKEQKRLEKSKEITQKELVDLAQDCYSKFEIFKTQHEYDSAAYYIEFRASLDTTNAKWANAAGLYIYDYLGDYPKALEYFFKTLSIKEKAISLDNPYISSYYSNIGRVYNDLHIFPKALEYHFKALSIKEKIYGPEYPDIADIYNSIGVSYETRGDHEKALEYFTKALSIIEKTYDPEKIDNNLSSTYLNNLDEIVSALYVNIGTVYDELGNYPKGLEYFFKALSIEEKIYGPEHPSVANVYNSIGVSYDKRGDNEKALEYYAKALSIWKKVLSPEHPDLATSYNNIGFIYGENGNYTKAWEYISKALSIWEKVLGPEHPDTKNVKVNLRFIEYLAAISNNNLTDFLSNHIFTETIVNEETPAGQQGMSGEYVLLEFADWTHNSLTSLHDKNVELSGKPKDILVYKDGIISRHHFDNVIGASFDIKEVSKEERLQIDQAYKQWKKQNKK